MPCVHGLSLVVHCAACEHEHAGKLAEANALLSRCRKVLWSVHLAISECPVCGYATNLEGHRRDCELAALLREIPNGTT